MSAFMLYAMVPFFWVLGLTATAARLPMLVFSMLGLAAMYKFTDDAFGNKHISLAVLAFGAINPWHIMQSRWALDCNMFPHLMMIGCWFLYRGIKALEDAHISTAQPRNRKSGSRNSQALLAFNPWLAGAMVFLAFCLYAYGIALYTVPVFLFAMAVYLLAVNKELFLVPLIISFVLFMLVAWPILTFVLINLFELPSIHFLGFTIPFFPYTTRTDDMLFFSNQPLRQLGWNARDLSRILLQQDDLPWNVIPGFGTLFMWSVPFTSLGLFSVFKSERKLSKTILLFWLAMAIYAALVVRGANVNRVNILFYPLIILTGIGLYEAVMLAKTPAVRQLVLAILIAVGGLSFGFFTRAYFGEHNRALSHMFFAEFLGGIEAAQEEGYDRLYVTNFIHHPNQWHLTEILVLFGARVEPTLYWDTVAFHDRYRFRNFDDVPHLPEAGVRTLYVFNVHEAHFFPNEMFYITWVNGFGVARFRFAE